MKCCLDTRTKYINVVISLKYDIDNINDILCRLDNWCTVNMQQYAYIIHDKDYDKETGEFKTIHIHLCGITKNVQRLSTILKILSETLNINALAISIEKLIDFACGVQYLTHKNNLDKYQYSIDDIKTNLNRNELETVYNCVGNSLNLDRLIDSVCSNNGKKHLIMRDIGLMYYHMYRNEINDLIIAWSNDEFKEKDLPF